MLVGPQLPPENVSLLRLAVARLSQEAEETIAVLGLVRARSEVSALAVTTHRLLTLGRAAQGYLLLEQIPHGDIVQTHVERDSLLAQGRVRVHTGDGVRLLGVLTPTGDQRAFDLLELALERVPRGMQTIMVPSAPGATPPTQPPEDSAEPVTAPAEPVAAPAEPVAQSPEDGDRHPVVAQLVELAGLHRTGALTDEEFSAAKARLLGGS